MSSRVRRRAVVLGACTTVVVAALALPSSPLNSVAASVLERTSSAQNPDTTEPAPITKVPKADPAHGLIYTGLTPAKAHTRCAGMYVVDGTNQCTHGPDKPPLGLDVHRPVPLVAPATDVAVKAPTRTPAESEVAGDAGLQLSVVPGAPALAAPKAAAAANGIVCEGDGRTGKRTQVLYVRESQTPDEFGKNLASIREWAADADAIYNNSAKETGGERHIRYVTTADCQIDVVPVELPTGSLGDFTKSAEALHALGYSDSNRLYMMFADYDLYCGIGDFRIDDTPGPNNDSNTGRAYARIDHGCWNGAVAAHELGHNLGAVNDSAPNSSHEGHCVDEYDVMCYKDAPGTVLKYVCTNKASENIMDCNHDDYYSTNPPAGSYLATHWNVANNDFLIKGAGTGTPPPPPNPNPSPSNPPPPPNPNPNPGLQPLSVTGTTSTTTVLSWPAGPAGAQYSVTIGGRSIGTTRGTKVTVVGLRPGQNYTIQIMIRTGSAALTPYTAEAKVSTPGQTTGPAAGWNVLSNALTNMAVDVYAGRAAAGTQVIAWPKHGAANQQWQLEQAADGTVLIRSKASNKCLAPVAQKTVENTLVVQYDCNTADATQRWRVATTQYGFTLTTVKGGLVLGVGTGTGTAKPLVLQRASGARFQSWVATRV